METNTTTTSSKPAVSKAEAPQVFREMTEKGVTQVKEAYEKMNVATTEAAEVIKNSYSTAVQGVQDYNNKFIEFAQINATAAVDFVQKLSSVRSPSTLMELSAEHARKQLETLTEQAKQLAAISQKVTLAAAEPIKVGVAKVFNRPA